jgi:hypothetical protein
MPLLILEGPDGSGKSSLATRLLKGTGLPTILVKRSGPPSSKETLLAQGMWIQDQTVNGLNVIADRHPLISESIYRPVVRREGPAWSPHEVAPLFSKNRGIVVIYCRPDWTELRRSSKVEKQMDGVAENYRALVEEYDRWMTIFRDREVEVWTYDYVHDREYTIIDMVRDFWERI